ncbi:MAG: DNA-protecting protein DprA, partial [Burkholderiales bacterium]|nr:DNA-protecting protein DprA [Burkholderiales bacterium]
MPGNYSDHDATWIDWLRLLSIPGIGSDTARKLLKEFGLPATLFQADFQALRTVVSDKIARAILQPPPAEFERQVALTADWLAQPENSLLCLADADYPASLLSIPDPPVLLFAKGRV